MRSAAFNTGSDFHLLDHIAPLAEQLSMPLFTTEDLNHTLACKYYPQIEVRHLPDLEFRLGEIAQQFDILFECKYWLPHLKSLFRHLHNKEMTLVFCPHGQSDKGYQTPLLAPFAEQDAVLLYGDLMAQMLKDLNIWPSLINYSFIGNYRLNFYRRYQQFYDALAEKEIFSKLPPQRTLLYAPTWRDADQSSSFFDFSSQILDQLPQDWNLIIKTHPLLEQRDPGPFYSIEALIEPKPNVLLINEFPPIYPILSRTDAYLGDASSIGYDFLFFQRPMYFFPSAYQGRLQTCGKTIDMKKNFFIQIEEKNRFVEKQKELYSYAFCSSSIS